MDPLHAMLAELVALERRLSRDAMLTAHAARDEPRTAGIAAGIAVDSRDHERALAARLNALFGDGPPSAAKGGRPARGSPSAALRHLYSRLQEAVIGYAALLSIATRSRDSWIIATEGTAAHMARQHQQEYLALSGRITQVLHDVVLEELDAAGLPCRCTCPSCGVGICLCAVGGRTILGEAWASARPVPFESGITVQLPRPGSPASLAGFQKGDCVVHVDGAEVDSAAVLISGVKRLEAGVSMPIQVRRPSGDVTLHLEFDGGRPADRVASNEDDCLRPSGPAFHHGRARDLQLRFRRLAADGAPGGFRALSAREIEVVRHIASGATNPEIAERLHISRPTVARHVGNILIKLSLSNRTEVASAAAGLGLLADS